MQLSDRFEGPEGSRRQLFPRRVRILFGGLSMLSALLAAALVVLPSGADDVAIPCPPGTAGTLTNISRPIAPIGVAVIRDFTVPGRAVTGMQLSAPPEYNAQQIPARNAFGLRFTAPRAGPFDVQGTWTQPYNGGACTAIGNSTLTAAQGSPLVVRPPPAEFNGRQYDNPADWTWKCSADTNPAPLDVTIRWEVGPRLLTGNTGGKPPYKFSRRAKMFSVRSGDSCDGRQVGVIEKRLAKNAKLRVVVGGSVESGRGVLRVLFKGEFRKSRRSSLLPLRLGVKMKQGSRTLVNSRICAWQQTGYEIAKGRGVSCWW